MESDIPHEKVNEREKEWCEAVIPAQKNRADPAVKESSSGRLQDDVEIRHALKNIQNCFKEYELTRNSAFSYVVHEHPAFSHSAGGWQEILNSGENRLFEDEDHFPWISAYPADVSNVMRPYDADPYVKSEVDDFFSTGDVSLFLKAVDSIHKPIKAVDS